MKYGYHRELPFANSNLTARDIAAWVVAIMGLPELQTADQRPHGAQEGIEVVWISVTARRPNHPIRIAQFQVPLRAIHNHEFALVALTPTPHVHFVELAPEGFPAGFRWYDRFLDGRNGPRFLDRSLTAFPG